MDYTFELVFRLFISAFLLLTVDLEFIIYERK